MPPTYTYQCDGTGEVFELETPIKYHKSVVECPGCGGWARQIIDVPPRHIGAEERQNWTKMQRTGQRVKVFQNDKRRKRNYES